MTTVNRRDFLKTSAAGASALMAGQVNVPASQTAPANTELIWPQRYGASNSRVGFGACWKDSPGHPFHHEDHPTFHCLRTSFDAHYSRAEQPISPLKDRPVRIEAKVRCEARAGRTLFTVGLKSKSHGDWAFSIGACPSWGIVFGELGWQIMVNAAKPWKERVSLAGYDSCEWHTFLLEIPGAQGPAKLHCDGQYVMDLVQPITDEQRAKEALEQHPDRHGSVSEPVPETPGEGEYLFVESRHPGQIIEVDRITISQEPLTTKRKALAVVLDRDWALDGLEMVENTPTPYEGNPVLSKADIPDPSGQNSGTFYYVVRKDETGFHMYLTGVTKAAEPGKMAAMAPYHAVSQDGLHWEVTPKHPILKFGAEGEWDEEALHVAGVIKEGGLYRMWYGGYVRWVQQGRAGYAESKDGINWVKPTAGLYPFAGKPSNVCFSLQPDLRCNEYELPVSVVRDDNAPPSRRYVMFLHTQGPHGFIVDVATSADGKRFVRAPHNARNYAFERIPINSKLHGAAVPLHEGDYWWAFVEQDQKGGARLRFTAWVTEPGETENISFGLWRSMRTHFDPDPTAKGGDQGRVTTVLEFGNEWWVYYSYNGNAGLAKIGRHRMYGLELKAGVDSGQVTTIAFEPPRDGWKHHHLTLNASKLGSASRIEAELLDARTGETLAGFSAHECVPIEKEGFDIPLEWQGKNLPSANKPLQVRLKITRGSGSPQIHGVYIKKNEAARS